jgi:hypothetical protein
MSTLPKPLPAPGDAAGASVRFQLQTQNAWTATAVAASIHVAGMMLELLLGRTLPSMPIWPSLASATLGAVLLVVLLLRRKAATIRVCSWLFLINSIAIAAALFVTHPYYAALGQKWVPFQANKLGCLITALLAPSFWVGLASIATMAGLAVFQFYLFPGEVRENLAVGEPWTTAAFAMSGVILLWYRLKRMEMERLLVVMHAEAAAIRDTARTFMRLRDLMNTPLQTIELSIEILRRKQGGLEPTLARMKSALKRLRKLNGLLAKYEARLNWEQNDLTFRSDDSSER